MMIRAPPPAVSSVHDLIYYITCLSNLSQVSLFHHVCSFIRIFYPCLTFTDRIHARERHVLEMDLMSLSAQSSLEMKDMTIWNFSGQLRLERIACWATTILFRCLWSLSLKISFSVYSPWSEQRWRICSTSGWVILSETSSICLCKC